MSAPAVKDAALAAAMSRCDDALMAAARSADDGSLTSTGGQLVDAVAIHTGIPVDDLGLSLSNLAARHELMMAAGVPPSALMFPAVTCAFLTGYLAARAQSEEAS